MKETLLDTNEIVFAKVHVGKEMDLGLWKVQNKRKGVGGGVIMRCKKWATEVISELNDITEGETDGRKK